MRANRGTRAVALAGVVALGLAACGEDTDGGDDGNGDGQNFVDSFTFGTGGTGGVYFPLGTEYAELFEEHIDGISVNAIETDASVDNLGRIFQEEMQLGLTQNDTANDAVHGTGQFEDIGAPLDNIGWLGKLYPEAAQVIVRGDAGYETVADLEGERISIGAPGSGTLAVAEQILSAHGLEEGDYEAYNEDFSSARALLQDGNLDASIEILGVPAASLNDLAATADVQLLSLEDSAAGEIAMDSAFEAYTIPADAYDFTDEDVTTLSVFAGMVASTTQVSEDHAYEITRVLYEHTDELTLAQGGLIDVDEALVGQGDIPLHPGAERYFEEQGLL